MKNEDLNIMKAIIIYLDWLDGCNKDYHPKGNYTIQDMISWLKKQCNKNPDDKIEQEWIPQVGDTIRKKGTTEPLYVLSGKEEYEFSFVEKRNCGISGGKLNVFALEDYELVERNKTIEDVIDETFGPLNEDLEKEIERYFRDVKWIYLPVAEVARHFADWQYNKDFEDLLKSDMSQFKKCYEKGREDMKKELKQITIE